MHLLAVSRTTVRIHDLMLGIDQFRVAQFHRFCQVTWHTYSFLKLQLDETNANQQARVLVRVARWIAKAHRFFAQYRALPYVSMFQW
jgi:hypothetical protein